MKTKFKIAIGIAVLMVLGGIALSIFPFSHQPRISKSLDEIGISISKNQLADIGCGTPEAALETHTWAMVNTNYDKMLESVAPQIRAIGEKDTSGRERFEAGIARGSSSFEGMHILAKKTVADNKVELKVATEQKQKDFTFAVCTIEQLTRIANEWKWDNSRPYDPAWDKDSQLEPVVK